MASILDRALATMELLATEPAGLALHTVADQLGMPRSAAHRLLSDLVRHGYVRQAEEGGPYRLTVRLVALGLSYLSRAGDMDVVQPILDDVAKATGELVRLSVVDGGRLVWVAKAQGAKGGLRYDPDMGAVAHLASTASGHAWLSTLDDDAGLTLVARQGLGDRHLLGPTAPRSLAEVADRIRLARALGYATQMESFVPGTSTVAVPVRPAMGGTTPGSAIGVLSVAGPVVRLTQARMEAIAPGLAAAAAEVAAASVASSLFGQGSMPPPRDGRPEDMEEGRMLDEAGAR